MADTKPTKPAAASTGPVLDPRTISRRDDRIAYEHPATRRAAWRDKLSEGLKTFLWVAPLTALIWIYAERAQITSLEMRVRIAVRSADPNRIVTIIQPIEREVTLDLRAPRASLDAIRERLSTNVHPIEVIIPDDIGPTFEGDISITDRIERNPLFQDWAVDVERSFPAVRIKVERRASRELPIEVRPEDSGFGKVTFQPATVKVEGPQSFIDKIPADQAIYTDLDKLRSYGPGPHEEIVSVLGFDQENVTKDPPRVLATVEILQGEALMLPSVAIYTAVPPTMLKFEKHVVSPRSPTLTNVEVTGPPAQIDRLRPGGNFQPEVHVKIELNDVLQGDFVKRITAENYVLPLGVTVVIPNREIPYTVLPR